ncbi:ABC-ATPase domain-containing protein [Aquibacillus koreensis]|uniref:ABC-ATPase domain-containing protein n=1 Tax=Aquibacillus koreensis TaxID=279446 RepID=A0A9X3WMZ3_9BACI|nr:ABC-ATPase domain-containing protein [Aquibacillus koreensis]MCT2535814.1 ABC-ATPase domain-containing protein [Aquibacillus koreensis]MDC3420269.1 ABC-ATPase domain-containing protein [Aquibacillus koreensis]
MKKLQQLLYDIDGKSYKAYKSIQGRYSFHRFEIMIDYVQGDPFAAPSKIRIIIPDAYRKMYSNWKDNHHRKVYAEDIIARSVAEAIHENTKVSKGSGKSGLIAIDAPGQEILERTAVTIDPNHVTICLSIGLPANGRRINGKEAQKLFIDIIPGILSQSVFSIKDERIEQAVQLADQHQEIRRQMKENGWVAFVADGAILPRQSGVSNKPLNHAVPFVSPKENTVEFNIPHQSEPLTGMAIKKGVTLIVGGGYHGKSTLLNAIERGVYHHRKGDGREYVLTDPGSVKVRAEDGRQVTCVNISSFINDLPHKQDTRNFSTENASGSTSQAANVVEALEAGASTILIDEDTSATNFMIRDQRMQALVSKEKEPITPFIDKIKQMKDQLDVSTILVMGGSGDYFDVADQVIMMDQYKPINVTEKAKEIASSYPSKRHIHPDESFGSLPKRSFSQNSLQTRRGKKTKVQAKGLSTIIMGKTDVNLQYVEQLVDHSQTNMIAEIIRYLDQQNILKQQSLYQLLDMIEQQMDQKGLASFAPFPNQHPGDLARPRRYEIAATLNRLRTAQVKDLL